MYHHMPKRKSSKLVWFWLGGKIEYNKDVLHLDRSKYGVKCCGESVYSYLECLSQCKVGVEICQPD